MPSTRNTRRSNATPQPAPRLRITTNACGQRLLRITYTADHAVMVRYEQDKSPGEQWLGAVDVVGVNEPGYDFPFTALLTPYSAQSLVRTILGRLDFAAHRSPAPLAAAA